MAKKRQKKNQLEQLTEALGQVNNIVKEGQKIAKGVRTLIKEIKGESENEEK
jgi:Flp pilus assembly protein TadB